MATMYRIIDVRGEIIDPEPIIVETAPSPEVAASAALGLHLVRSGAKKDLVARVYWDSPGHPTSMVRLYATVEPRDGTNAKPAKSHASA